MNHDYDAITSDRFLNSGALSRQIVRTSKVIYWCCYILQPQACTVPYTFSEWVNWISISETSVNSANIQFILQLPDFFLNIASLLHAWIKLPVLPLFFSPSLNYIGGTLWDVIYWFLKMLEYLNLSMICIISRDAFLFFEIDTLAVLSWSIPYRLMKVLNYIHTLSEAMWIDLQSSCTCRNTITCWQNDDATLNAVLIHSDGSC